VKPVVAVYVRHFLTISMTFVQRQLRGVEESFPSIVLAAERHHEDLFPHDRVVLQNVGWTERVVRLLKRSAGRGYGHVSPRRLRGWASACREHGVRMIHAHFGNRGIEILPLARELDIPLLVTFHGQDASSHLRNPGYRRGLRELFAHAHVLAVSQAIADRLVAEGADPERLEVHRVGIPLEVFTPVDRTPLCRKREVEWLQVSNFVEKKGHQYTVAAFRRLLEHKPESRLTLAGDGPLRSEIERSCAGLGDRVRFPGKVSEDQVLRAMRSADVFLHHSVTAQDGDQEGIPTVIMEAMATGLPVLSTHHAGIPELVEDGVTGHLVPERDVDAYLQKMLAVLEDDGSLGRRASRSVREHYSLETQNARLRDHYAEVLGAAAGNRATRQ
jgi:glycosyltransferase involved in cell wall biosynthesis